MKIITSNDISYENVEVLCEIFTSEKLHAVTKAPDGYANARVDITFPSTKDDQDMEVVLIVWVSSAERELLTLRVVLVDRKDRDRLKKNNELWQHIIDFSEEINNGSFGYLSPSNFIGITLDYTLTIKGGIPDSTLINSAKEIASIAQATKSFIYDFLK